MSTCVYIYLWKHLKNNPIHTISRWLWQVRFWSRVLLGLYRQVLKKIKSHPIGFGWVLEFGLLSYLQISECVWG